MAVDKTELAKDLDTPEYQAFVKEELAKKDFIIRSKDEETQFQTRFKTDVIEKEIPGKVKEIYDNLDKDIKTLYNIDRNQDEKTYDYLKRAATTRNTDYDNAKKEVAALKEQIAQGDTSGVVKKQLQEAEEKARIALETKDKELNELRTKHTTTEKKALLSDAYVGVKSKFKKELPSLFARTEKAILDEALSIAVIKEGKIYKGDGNGGIAKDGSFKEITLEEHLLAEFKEVIDTKAPPKPGAGSGGAGKDGIDPTTITKENFVRPETVKSRGDLMDYMLELGLARGTKQFNEIWAKFANDLK
jgi:hypothetical protein